MVYYRLMDSTVKWISQVTERTLTVEYHASGVTDVTPTHDTGWRTLPVIANSFITGYEAVLNRPGLPDLRIHPGQSFCVPPGQHHRVAVAGQTGGVSRWTHMAFRLLGGIDVFSFLNTPTVFTGSTARRIGKINEELFSLYTLADAPLHRVVRRKALAFDLLTLLIEQSTVREDRVPGIESVQRLSGVMEMISKDLCHPPNVNQMARACSLSVSRFHAIFKSAMGVSPRRYLQDLQIQRAKQLLLAGDLPVKTVASEAGFGDVFHFSRLFHKRCGVSPSTYRAQVRDRQYF